MNEGALTKVPAVTLGFWIIKIAATTLGETGGDTVTMTWLHANQNAHSDGYLIGTGIFLAVLVALVVWQTLAPRIHPFLYWATIVGSTTAGTAMADFADRSLGVGYTGGSTILFICLMATLALWYWSLGYISVATVNTPKVEFFYWAAITFSQTLGTALGDWLADTGGFGYEGSALGVRGGARGARRALLLDQHFARIPVLGGLHPNTPARRHRRRPARQAGEPWRSAPEPAARLGPAGALHLRLHHRVAAARGPASRRSAGDPLARAERAKPGR